VFLERRQGAPHLVLRASADPAPTGERQPVPSAQADDDRDGQEQPARQGETDADQQHRE
jgi:hypothetical protein